MENKINEEYFILKKTLRLNIEEKINEAIKAEKYFALKHYGKFIDNNHFLGVLYEEIKESQSEFDYLLDSFDNVKKLIFNNTLDKNNLHLKNLENKSINLIFELIQVLSCIEKYKIS